MKLATLANGTPDGRLHLVSRDHTRCMPAKGADTLQALIEDWTGLAPRLEDEYRVLNAGGGEPFNAADALAPLPRAWQWLDGSAYASHGRLMDQVFGISAGGSTTRPLMYQGLSDRFIAPCANVPLPSEEDGIDFEGEFGIVCDHVAMGTSPEAAAAHIRLLVQINDWSLRKIAPVEMKTGFGWVQAKPACSMAPVAITPDELGSRWRDCRIDLPLAVDWNGERFGNAGGYDMAFGFDTLIAHAARTRDLVAGTIIGSGTVSNDNFRDVGSSCIAERRGIEIVDEGEARTEFMAFGDRVRMECMLPDGTPLFGAIDQKVVKG